MKLCCDCIVGRDHGLQNSPFKSLAIPFVLSHMVYLLFWPIL